MSLDEFLAWEETQELRWEFDGFAPMAMTGGTAAHSAIQLNLYLAVGGRLRGRACRIYTADLKVQVAGSIRYLDGFVVCSLVLGSTLVVTDPVVVFEVLSPSTASIDFGAKNEEYRDTPSIQRYVMLAQDQQRATVFERIDGDWVGHIMSGETLLRMPEIGIEVPLAELYTGVELSKGSVSQPFLSSSPSASPDSPH
jgi:Uma2 family endonuclease